MAKRHADGTGGSGTGGITMPNKNMGFRLAFKTNKTAGKKGEVMIYSAISGAKWWGDETTAIDFDKALKELGDVEEITVRINSPGGEVASAIAIRTALMKHKASKTVDIEGQCCSAATLIACIPGAKVRIARGSDYMIHRCSLGVRGNVNVIRSAMESMVNTDNAIADIYAEKTGKRDREGYLKLMDKTEWYDAEGAIAEGFADEIIEASEGEEPIAACAVTEDVYKIMQDIYENVPELNVIKTDATAEQEDESNRSATGASAPCPDTVSNEKTAVAAGNSSENMGHEPETKGGNLMEPNNATAEATTQANPATDTQNAVENALKAERERVRRIRNITPRGAKWDKMRDAAIEDGQSVEDYMTAIFAEQEKTGEEFISNRIRETEKAGKIGAGDATDLDGENAKDAEDKLAKELADLASNMTNDVMEMA